jgi:hypothetical protein
MRKRTLKPRTLAPSILVATLSLAAAWPLAAHAAPGKPRLALDGRDPVALCEGRDVAGSEADSVALGRFIYRFESAASRERFLADPVRWSIQNGGACGKMGVLSGLGSPSRWLVHEGRVYVFASDICRERFLAEPAAFVHRTDAVPAPSPEEAKRARQALDRAARAYGKGFDRLRSLELAIEADYVGRDSSISTGRQLHQWEFPGRYREHEEWPTITYGHSVDGSSSFQFERDDDWVDDAQVTAIVRMLMWREPLLLVHSRRDPALVARHLGQEMVAGETADLVQVAIHGATTVLAVGTRSGRVLEARFPARTNFGDRPVVQAYSDFRAANGLSLPHRSVRLEDGKPSRSPILRLTAVRTDVTFPSGRFAPRD